MNHGRFMDLLSLSAFEWVALVRFVGLWQVSSNSDDRLGRAVRVCVGFGSGFGKKGGNEYRILTPQQKTDSSAESKRFLTNSLRQRHFVLPRTAKRIGLLLLWLERVHGHPISEKHRSGILAKLILSSTFARTPLR
jgi:hypothetical protein